MKLTIEEIRGKFSAAMSDAIAKDDSAAITAALGVFAEDTQTYIMDAVSAARGGDDIAVLAGRGSHTLTKKESEYYNDLIGALKSGDVKNALTSVNTVLPETVIEQVFLDIAVSHPLLEKISFTNTKALVKWFVSDTTGTAVWGLLTDTITAEVGAAFSEVDLTLAKLSAFIPVNNAYLDLGPEWLDRYVREILTEAIAVQLEAGIVDGDGKNKPLGMTRQLTNATDGVYPRKPAVGLTSFDPPGLAPILATIAVTTSGKARAVTDLLFIVNPADYYTKVYPAITIRTADGRFTSDALPFPMTVVQSAAVPAGFAVIGMANRYWAGLGTQSGGKLEYSDEYKWLEDLRVYRIKLYGNGRALDANSFVYVDISNLAPADLSVFVTNSADFT
ncbi:MAG: phage major capsid protein [Oscillospiraceae bacterium]|jgi:HK97 family phage major capsid protein|nr:phage major capsid protein [Oscillospiraceae bacterium]